jgi:glycerol-3-phosphate dehydrogenase (NAD(P)+)
VPKITVFGAGAMGTAFAMHLARTGNETVLWASPFDQKVLAALTEDRRHPTLPEHLPESLAVLGPDHLEEAVAGIDLAVMGAHSGGARTLARIVAADRRLPLVVGVAKGLEPETGKRMSEVYAEEVGHDRVVSVGGPCLAAEVAQDLPTAAVFASASKDTAEEAARAFRSRTFLVAVTDDVVGLELCTVAKNVAAIGMGILDGLGKVSGLAHQNAKAALFTHAVDELTELVVALGGRAETASGLAGLGDALVTSLGGRNRLYGELLGEGAEPATTLAELTARGLTVEGVVATQDIRRLTERAGLYLPFFEQVDRILRGSARPESVLDCLAGLPDTAGRSADERNTR